MTNNFSNWSSAFHHTKPIVAIGLLIVFAVLMLGWQRLMQNETFFAKVRSLTEYAGLKSYTEADNEGSPIYPSYRPVDNDHLLSWDAAHYKEIAQSLYKDIWTGNFAFYPLFPMLWKVTGFSPRAISILNYLMFCIGIGILVMLFAPRMASWTTWTLLLLPCLTPYMIPYSESLFFVCAAIGIYGLDKGHYWMYFIGFMMASMTRAAGNIMGIAWVIVDIIAWMYQKTTIRQMLTNMWRHLLPIAAGVALVLLFQHWRGAEHWFQYALAQQEWGKSLDWPTLNWTDWSREGKSISWPLIYAFGLPMLVYLTMVLSNGLRGSQPKPFDTQDGITVFCVLFLTGNILLAMLTQHGCMYSQARLLTCTPFFVYLVLRLTTTDLPTWSRWGLTLIVAAVACRFLYMFSRTYLVGIWIFVFLSVLMLWGNRMHKVFRTIVLVLGIGINLLWQAQLFNIFLEESRLFI
ncbi:MAG: hypothetical protein IJ764_03540 [Bacteroidales bacterium]|nr:hypothetical protein [Bacteroidales bacterium]